MYSISFKFTRICYYYVVWLLIEVFKLTFSSVITVKLYSLHFIFFWQVKEKFLACLSVSCLYLAAAIEKIDVDPQKLVTISQSKCTVKDLQRMCDIIKKKLGVENNERPITVLDYLNIFMKIIDDVTVEMLSMKPMYSTPLKVSYSFEVDRKCFIVNDIKH